MRTSAPRPTTGAGRAGMRVIALWPALAVFAVAAQVHATPAHAATTAHPATTAHAATAAPPRAVPAAPPHTAPAPSHAAVSPEWAQRWRDDLTFLEQTLPATHANLFHTMPRDSFEARIERLRRAVPGMAHHEIVVAIAGLVAGVHDGHTRLTLPVDPAAGFFGGHSSTPAPKIDELMFHQLPIRFYLYEDGLFVRRVGADHARTAGGRVLRIGRMSAADAMRAVEPVVQRDNATQVRNLLPDVLVVPEVLAARGVTSDPLAASFEIETTAGRRMTLELRAVPIGGAVTWADARDTSKAPPLYLRDPESNYWFEPLDGDRVVYMQYNTVYDREDESIEAFTDRLVRFIDAHPVEALVIDIRGNPGGNNSRNRPLLKGLIGCVKLQEPGRVFVIIGRGTFSAAMMFAVDLEKYMDAIFVGEPTGASPNGYGDSRKVTLPNSGLTVRASTLHWQYSDPRDDRDAITPQIAAPLRSVDYAANRDPALETVRSIVTGPPRAPALAGTHAGTIHAGPGVYAFSLVADPDGRTATFEVPEFGMAATRVEHLASTAERLTFDVPLERGAMHVAGRWMNGWLIGSIAVPASGTYLLLIPPR
jgi:hypothetical protein